MEVGRRGANEHSFVVAVGAPQNGFLLSQKSGMMSARGQKDTVRLQVDLLNWTLIGLLRTLANSCGGANSGHVILGVLSTAGVKGMDIEYLVPLTQMKSCRTSGTLDDARPK